MEAGFRLQESKIAIIGLGLMGGSLALALRGKCAALYGVDADQAAFELALSRGIVDEAVSDPAKVLLHADLVILATPVPAILDFLQRLPALMQTPCIVLDLGSTKRQIIQAMADLPENFDPLGGHPICGKERLGLENAEADIYRQAPFVISPSPRTTSRAKSAAQQIIAGIGAHCIEMTAEEHDRILGMTSHLPFLLASALAGSTPCEHAALIGPGFRSASRLAGTPSHMMLGILQSNRDNILQSIQSFRKTLEEMESALQREDFPKLEILLSQSRSAYQSLVPGH